MPKVTKKSVDIGREMEYMLATGNLRSRSGLGLQQVHLEWVVLCIVRVLYGRIMDSAQQPLQYNYYIHMYMSNHVVPQTKCNPVQRCVSRQVKCRQAFIAVSREETWVVLHEIFSNLTMLVLYPTTKY